MSAYTIILVDGGGEPLPNKDPFNLCLKEEPTVGRNIHVNSQDSSFYAKVIKIKTNKGATIVHAERESMSEAKMRTARPGCPVMFT